MVWLGIRCLVDLDVIRLAIPGWAYRTGRQPKLQALAEACGKNRVTVGRLLTAGQYVSFSTVVAILDELGIDFYDAVRPVEGRFYRPSN